SETDHVADLVSNRIRPRRLEGQNLDVLFGARARERRAVEEGSLSAAADPFLARSEIEDVAEEHIGHRGPIGHGERDREEGHPALRVHAPVDGIENEARSRGTEGALPQLLRDERELDASRRELLQPGDNGALGGRVDRGRVVPALAGADHRLPFQPGRVLGQDGVEIPGDLPAEGEPVGHSSNGAKTSPLVSLGKKYVVFSGRSSPAPATFTTCSIVGARTRKAASALPLRTASSAATALGV